MEILNNTRIALADGKQAAEMVHDYATGAPLLADGSKNSQAEQYPVLMEGQLFEPFLWATRDDIYGGK